MYILPDADVFAAVVADILVRIPAFLLVDEAGILADMDSFLALFYMYNVLVVLLGGKTEVACVAIVLAVDIQTLLVLNMVDMNFPVQIAGQAYSLAKTVDLSLLQKWYFHFLC